jgi:Protein of unknown function (DUF3558)
VANFVTDTELEAAAFRLAHSMLEMLDRSGIGLVVVVAAAMMITGCTGDDRADPAPTTTVTTTGTTSRPPGIPAVADPMDLRPFYLHPCATLTTTQQNQLELRPRVRESAGDWAGMCNWARDDADHDYNYLLVLDLRSDRLVDAYQRRDAREPGGGPIWELFEPREVRGFPAVTRSFSTHGDHCEVIVDTGNGHSIAISGSLRSELDPGLCDRLVTAAEWVVDALRR